MMTAEQRAEAAEYRSSQFRRLMRNPVLLEALEALRAESTLAWRSTTPEDIGGREDAWNALRAVDRLERYLSSQAEDGAVTAHNLAASIAAMRKPSRN